MNSDQIRRSMDIRDHGLRIKEHNRKHPTGEAGTCVDGPDPIVKKPKNVTIPAT